ncbi:MAG TPA: hydrogenase [Planctomycetota bacterium]|nr:hydrogenase [Planctomycetota bacterium]
MNHTLDGLLVLVVLLDFFALGTSRVMALIRASAMQGVVLAGVPLLVHAEISGHALLIAVGSLVVKGFVVPLLLMRAIRDVTIRREVEPLIGFTASLLLGGLGAGLALVFSGHLPLAPEHAQAQLVPASFATIFTGFLMLTTRQKAITQVVGYMFLDNGIFLFGLLLIDAMPFLVEVGVLLDLVVAVFVMGIILHRIQRTFSTINTTQFSTLKE